MSRRLAWNPPAWWGNIEEVETGAAKPAKVFTADPPEGGDYWVVERDPATGRCRLVAP